HERASRTAAGVLSRHARGLPQPRPAPAPARLGGLDHRHVGLQRRDRCLRLPPGRRVGGRARRIDPLSAGRLRRAVHVRARRPPPPCAGDALCRPTARVGARRDGGVRARRSPGGGRLRTCRRGRDHLDRLPARAGRAAARLGANAGGADRRQRQLEHPREPRVLRRSCTRRRAVGGLEHVGRLRRDRVDVPVVGADAERVASLRRGAAHARAPLAPARGQRRLAGTFGLAIAGAGGPILFIAPNPSTEIALVAFALIGVANIVEDVAGFTLLQRTAPAEVLARVFGVLHSLFLAMTGLGAILAPRLIDLIGVRWSLVCVGAFLPILTLATRLPLVRLDDSAVDRAAELDLLREIPIFAPLSPPVLEGLAARLVPVHAAAGKAIVREGESGDRFYV